MEAGTKKVFDSKKSFCCFEGVAAFAFIILKCPITIYSLGLLFQK
jgi:hypothetical protein